MAATHVRRWQTGDSTANFGAGSNPTGHNEERLVIVDWISVKLSSTAGGYCTFQLTESGASETSSLVGIIYQAGSMVAAGESEFFHIQFPGGLPCWRPQSQDDTAPTPDILCGVPVAYNNIVIASDADTCVAHIGFHVERASNRR